MAHLGLSRSASWQLGTPQDITLKRVYPTSLKISANWSLAPAHLFDGFLSPLSITMALYMGDTVWLCQNSY